MKEKIVDFLLEPLNNNTIDTCPDPHSFLISITSNNLSTHDFLYNLSGLQYNILDHPVDVAALCLSVSLISCGIAYLYYEYEKNKKY